MRNFNLFAVSVTFGAVLWSTTAMAQANDEGAAKLLAVFQTYLGTTEGVVDVAVEGGSYLVTIDPAVQMAALPEADVAATITPLELTVTDNGDGTWAYDMDQPVAIAYAVPDMMTSNTKYGQVVLSGVFDEALGDSREYSLEMNDMVTEQTQSDPTMGEISTKLSQKSLTMNGTAVAVGDAVTSTFTTEISGVTYDMTLPGMNGAPPFSVTATAASGAGKGGITGYQPSAVYGLMAYFVAHPSQALIDADRPALKTAIEAALPVFENLIVTGAYSDVAATTPMGPVTLDELGFTVDMNGAVADGKFREAFTLKGLTLGEGMVPAFAAPLVPSEMTLDFTASGFDLAAAAGLGLGLLDLPAGAAAPEGFDAQMMAAIMPKGTVDITIAPGEAAATAYRLTYEGAMTVGPTLPMPVGKARIGLTGMDKINEALLASPPEMGMQEMAPMLGMAQMMAQPGVDGELIWEIEATATGGLLVNGQDLMGGGQ